jgi:hypothetical protein
VRDVKAIVRNLVYKAGYLRATIREGVAALKPFIKDLEVVHIRLDHPDPSTWRKKKHYHIMRQKVCSWLDSWIFEHLVTQDEYAAYLERYRPLKKRGEIEDIDEHILDTHYRPRAITILRHKKSFDLERWTRDRVRLEYRRRSNLYWKGGEEHSFDCRNLVESFFIRKNNGDKEVIGVGGGGGSGQREAFTFFTAVFHILGKNARIPRILLKQNGLNELEYVGCKYRALLTADFGNNYELDESLAKEIRNEGFYWDVTDRTRISRQFGRRGIGNHE